MSGLDKYYQILGLNPGASEEEIKEAYRDLINVWHPDRFSNNQRLREKANEKLKEINIAYNKLKSHIAGGTFTTSDGQSYDDSPIPPHEPPLQSEKEQYTGTDDKDQGDFQPPPGQPSSRPQSDATDPIYAGFWHRFTAAFIDSFIVAAGSTMLSLPFLIAKGLSRTPSSPFWVVFDSILFILIGWLYCTLFESSTKCATIGKMAVGIIVTDIDGNRISFARANGRCWGKSISFLILGIGYIMTGFTRKKQALHDLMADTLVLARPEGIRTWLTTSIIGGIAVLLVILVALIALNQQPTRETDYTQTTSAPPSSFSEEQPTSTQTLPETGLSAVDWYNKGSSLLSLGNYTESIRAFTEAIALDPHLTEAYDGRALSYYKLGKFQEVIKDLDKVIEARPRDAKAYRIRGNLHFNLGNIPESVKDMKIVAELEPKPPQPQPELQTPQGTYQKEAFIPASEFNKRGLKYFNKAEYNKAIDNFTTALSIGINPSYSTYIYRGRSYYKIKLYDKAIEDFEQAISLAPDNAKAHGWCGIISYERECYYEAANYFGKAIELDPNSAIYYLNRGYAYIKIGLQSSAASDFKKACDLGDEDACRQLRVLGYR